MFIKNTAVLFLFLFLFAVSSWSKVVVYEKPTGISASDRYAVTIEQQDSTYTSFVYMTTSPAVHNAPPGHTTSFSTFSFSGTVTVTITRLDGNDVSDCVIRPKHNRIVPAIEGSSVSFTLQQPQKLSVEFEQDLRYITHEGNDLPVVQHSMLLFADPLETEVPDSTDSHVIWFGPGVHRIGSNYRIPNNKTCYIAGGAYLIGSIANSSASNIKILGRGILSGEHHTEWRQFHLMDFGGNSRNISIEGITLLDSPNYNLILGGSGHTVRHVKMISWYGQTDGADAPGDGVMEDCFLKVNDDAVKLYRSNSIVRRCVIWIQRTGAPFQFTWNMGGEIVNNHVYNCDVIHAEWEVEHLNRGIFTSIGGGDGHLHNWVFEDIRVEGHAWRVAYLQMKKTKWSPQPDYGEIDHMTFRDIQVEGPALEKSIIRGATDEYGPESVHYYHDIFFDSVTIAGQCMNRNDFEIDAATTYNLNFACGGEVPRVSFVKPEPGQTFLWGENVTVNVIVEDLDDNVEYVELFLNGNRVKTLNAPPFQWGGEQGDKALMGMKTGRYQLKVIVQDADGLSIQKTRVFEIDGGLPSGWRNRDVGETGIRGDAYFRDGELFLQSAGSELADHADAFHSVYSKQYRDFECIAHLKQLDPFTLAGIMIRENMQAGAKHAALMVTPDSTLLFLSRRVNNWMMNIDSLNTPVELPVWLKLIRIGDECTGYYSNNAVDWRQIGQMSIPMDTWVYACLLTTHPDTSRLSTAVFDTMGTRYDFSFVKQQGMKSLPNEFALYQNIPNPFNPNTTIRYRLSAPSSVKLQVFDVQGRSVALLVDHQQQTGEHQVQFDASDLASGIYICRLLAVYQGGRRTLTRKLMLLK